MPKVASVLHYASDAGSLELPDTRFAARKCPQDHGIAPTTLKNKARPASANQAARRGAADKSLPGGETSHQAAANASVQALIARTQP